MCSLIEILHLALLKIYSDWFIKKKEKTSNFWEPKITRLLLRPLNSSNFSFIIIFKRTNNQTQRCTQLHTNVMHSNPTSLMTCALLSPQNLQTTKKFPSFSKKKKTPTIYYNCFGLPSRASVLKFNKRIVCSMKGN